MEGIYGTVSKQSIKYRQRLDFTPKEEERIREEEYKQVKKFRKLRKEKIEFIECERLDLSHLTSFNDILEKEEEEHKVIKQLVAINSKYAVFEQMPCQVKEITLKVKKPVFSQEEEVLMQLKNATKFCNSNMTRFKHGEINNTVKL